MKKLGLQFSLRAMMAFFVIIAILLALKFERERARQGAIARIEVAGGQVRQFRGRLFLDINSTDKKIFESIGLLRETKHVELHDVDVSEIGLQWTAKLPELTSLDLSNCKIRDEDLSPLAEAKLLLVLDLSGTGISNDGLKYIRNLTKLRELSLAKTEVNDQGLEYCRDLNSLMVLRLNATGVEGRGIRKLRGLPDLRQLYLDETRVSGLDEVEQLKSLQVLSLRKTDISDAQLRRFRCPMSLISIDVTGSDVTKHGVEQLMTSFPDVDVRFGNQ